LSGRVTTRRSASHPWRGGVLALVVGLCGCAPAPPAPTLVAANDRPFDFARDTFAFVNELEWRYRFDPATGTVSHDGANREAEYTQRCFVLSRSARQFFQFARFDPDQPRIDDAGYRRRVRLLIKNDPSETGEIERIVIPGYVSLREFSRDWEQLLKQELGGWEDSHFQRGNWRMLWPFPRSDQEGRALAMAEEIAVHRPPVVHLADFPTLNINHAVLLYGVTETRAELRFDVYDPNDSSQPWSLSFVRGDGRFRLERTRYFSGGTVDVYEVYRSAFY
jgi:hypothetical protein